MLHFCCTHTCIIRKNMNQKQLETLRKNNEETRDFIRSCISFALMVLLKDENNIEDITISRLCTVAGVSRTAFYRNYKSVEDVLEDKIKGFALQIAGKISSDVYNNWLAVFQVVDNNRKDFESIIKGGYEYKIYDVFMSLLPKDEDNRNIQTVWLSLFYTYIVKWVKEGKPKKAEEMARFAYKYTKNIPLVAV